VTLARAIPLLSALSAVGCQDRLVHVFGGYAYDPAQDCLVLTDAVDVVAGPAPAAPCPVVRCWLGPDGVAYVTDTACDAPPDYQDETKISTGACVKALAAYQKKGHQLCPAAVDAGAGAGS
jgi:hypothetical protein